MGAAPTPESPKEATSGSSADSGELRLPPLVAAVVERLVRALSPERVILFGSWAHGRVRQQSDVDLLVVTQTGGDTRSAERRARQLVGSCFPPVDVVVAEPSEVASAATGALAVPGLDHRHRVDDLRSAAKLGRGKGPRDEAEAALAPKMGARGNGSIINVASMAGQIGLAGGAAYGAQSHTCVDDPVLGGRNQPRRRPGKRRGRWAGVHQRRLRLTALKRLALPPSSPGGHNLAKSPTSSPFWRLRRPAT